MSDPVNLVSDDAHEHSYRKNSDAALQPAGVPIPIRWHDEPEIEADLNQEALQVFVWPRRIPPVSRCQTSFRSVRRVAYQATAAVPESDECRACDRAKRPLTGSERSRIPHSRSGSD